jgi:hypothetical protein
MGEARAEQVTFGWSTESTENASSGTPEPRTHRPAAKPSERVRSIAKPRASRANGGEPELPPDNELWDVHAAARFLKRSVSWVYHKAEDGTLPVTRLGGWGLRFIPTELRAWVASGAPRRR